MKTIMILMASVIMSMAIVFLGFAFVLLELNPLQWSLDARVSFMLLGIPTALIMAMISLTAIGLDTE